MSQHPHFGRTRHGDLPVHARTTDHLASGSWYTRINSRLAVWITLFVGSMTCAWIFAGIAIAGLPQAMGPGGIGLLYWISGSFLQLTLLSVIIVGQNIGVSASDARAVKTFEDAEDIKAAQITALDLLDEHTAGGIKAVLDAIRALAVAGAQVSGSSPAAAGPEAGERLVPHPATPPGGPDAPAVA